MAKKIRDCFECADPHDVDDMFPKEGNLICAECFGDDLKPMHTLNIYLTLPEDHDGETAPAFMHDLIKYTLEDLEFKDLIAGFEWEIVPQN